jgi:hypothetical protein
LSGERALRASRTYSSSPISEEVGMPSPSSANWMTCFVLSVPNCSTKSMALFQVPILNARSLGDQSSAPMLSFQVMSLTSSSLGPWAPSFASLILKVIRAGFFWTRPSCTSLGRSAMLKLFSGRYPPPHISSTTGLSRRAAM